MSSIGKKALSYLGTIPIAAFIILFSNILPQVEAPLQTNYGTGGLSISKTTTFNFDYISYDVYLHAAISDANYDNKIFKVTISLKNLNDTLPANYSPSVYMRTTANLNMEIKETDWQNINPTAEANEKKYTFFTNLNEIDLTKTFEVRFSGNSDNGYWGTLYVGQNTEAINITEGGTDRIENKYYKIMVTDNRGSIPEIYGSDKINNWRYEADFFEVWNGNSQVILGGADTDDYCYVLEDARPVRVILKCDAGEDGSSHTFFFYTGIGTIDYLLDYQGPSGGWIQHRTLFGGTDDSDDWYKVSQYAIDWNPDNDFLINYNVSTGWWVGVDNSSDEGFFELWNADLFGEAKWTNFNNDESGPDREKITHYSNWTSGWFHYIPSDAHIWRRFGFVQDANKTNKAVENTEKEYTVWKSTALIGGNASEGGCTQGYSALFNNATLESPSGFLGNVFTCDQSGGKLNISIDTNNNATQMFLEIRNFTLGRDKEIWIYNNSLTVPSSADCSLHISNESGTWKCINDCTLFCPSNGTTIFSGNATNYTSIVNYGSQFYVVLRFEGDKQHIKVQNVSLSTANEIEGRNAIKQGIWNSLGYNVPMWTDQQIYTNNLTNYQENGTFDVVTANASKRWAFNYVIGADVATSMKNLSTSVYILELIGGKTSSDITSEVGNFINQTKFS